MLDHLFSSVKDVIDNKVILITGGTGTFGHEITKVILENYNPKKLIIFSRDEFKQYNMKKIYPESKYNNIRYFIGDVRDYDRLMMAFQNVDIIFHAAAMKQVDTIEYNPFEAVKTNIYGTENVIKAAILNKVDRVIGVSTDKCVSPANLYGATKLCLEKLIIHGNIMVGEGNTKFCVLRYGNVINSRGSVVPLFLQQKKNKCFTITDRSFLRCVVYDKNWFVGVHNPIIVYNGKDASERFIQSIFINYVDEGVYRGTRRDFVLSMDGLKDIKSDKTIDEIKDKEYTIDDLNELLKFIELNNITTIQKENVPEINFSKEMLTKLKGESSTEIYTQQYKLLSNLSKILNKSNKIQLYQEALRNFYELNLDRSL